MSKKKDRERAAQGEVFRDGKVSKLTRCPVPRCTRYVITGNSAHGLCPPHEEMLDFLLFVLPQIKTESVTPKASGLILPGQPGYTVSIEAIKKAANGK